MEKKTLLSSHARQIDLVEYLSSLGIQPHKIRNQDYWYRSPLRVEKTPSFKVNRNLNVWYDHGLGKGGNLIDFGILYFNCSLRELLDRLRLDQTAHFSFHQPSPAGEKKEITENKIMILGERSLTSNTLLQYLEQRQIPVEVAGQYCREVDFRLYGKNYSAIGFKNNAGGYELRNRNFQGSNSPKGVTLICGEGSKELLVFEGFFDFLSFQTQQFQTPTIATDLSKMPGNFLIMNSLSFFEKSRQIMEKYERVHLFLDRDQAGLKCTKQALGWSLKYKDESIRYRLFKDYNEYWIGLRETGLRQSRDRRHRL